MPLIYTSLSSLVEDFLRGPAPEAALFNTAAFHVRMEALMNRLVVAKYTLTDDTLRFVDPNSILKAAERGRATIDRMARPAHSASGRDTGLISHGRLKTRYLMPFMETLEKCFGANTGGKIHFTASQADGWDVVRPADLSGFLFGRLPIQDFIFRARVGEFFTEIAGCTVRVYTDQSYKGVPFHELYGFLLHPDKGIQGIDFLSLERAYNTDVNTGMPLSPENNVIYCDLEGHKLPSFEID